MQDATQLRNLQLHICTHHRPPQNYDHLSIKIPNSQTHFLVLVGTLIWQWDHPFTKTICLGILLVLFSRFYCTDNKYNAILSCILSDDLRIIILQCPFNYFQFQIKQGFSTRIMKAKEMLFPPERNEDFASWDNIEEPLLGSVSSLVVSSDHTLWWNSG